MSWLLSGWVLRTEAAPFRSRKSCYKAGKCQPEEPIHLNGRASFYGQPSMVFSLFWPWYLLDLKQVCLLFSSIKLHLTAICLPSTCEVMLWLFSPDGIKVSQRAITYLPTSQRTCSHLRSKYSTPETHGASFWTSLRMLLNTTSLWGWSS